MRTEPTSGAKKAAPARSAATLALSFRQLFQLLEQDADFQRWYTESLVKSEHEAFFWEHPALFTENFDTEAEFVLIGAPSLARVRPDARPFKPQFERNPGEDVITFPNLGGDALLIVPCPVAPFAAYPHLAAFVRQAPEAQINALWSTVAKAVRENVTATPRWLSTAGLGVSWLHLRLDTRPKYYRFAPYKNPKA